MAISRQDRVKYQNIAEFMPPRHNPLYLCVVSSPIYELQADLVKFKG